MTRSTDRLQGRGAHAVQAAVAVVEHGGPVGFGVMPGILGEHLSTSDLLLLRHIPLLCCFQKLAWRPRIGIDAYLVERFVVRIFYPSSGEVKGILRMIWI